MVWERAEKVNVTQETEGVRLGDDTRPSWERMEEAGPGTDSSLGQGQD